MNPAQTGESSRTPGSNGAPAQNQEQSKDYTEKSQPIGQSEETKKWVKVNLPVKLKESFCRDPESFSTEKQPGETTEEHFARYTREQNENLGVPIDPSRPVIHAPEGLSQQVLNSQDRGVVYLETAGITASQSHGRVILPGTQGEIDLTESSPETVSDFASSCSS